MGVAGKAKVAKMGEILVLASHAKARDLGRAVRRGEVLADDPRVGPPVLVKKDAVRGLDLIDAKVGWGSRNPQLRQNIEAEVVVKGIARGEMAEVIHS